MPGIKAFSELVRGFTNMKWTESLCLNVWTRVLGLHPTPEPDMSLPCLWLRMNIRASDMNFNVFHAMLRSQIPHVSYRFHDLSFRQSSALNHHNFRTSQFIPPMEKEQHNIGLHSSLQSADCAVVRVVRRSGNTWLGKTRGRHGTPINGNFSETPHCHGHCH